MSYSPVLRHVSLRGDGANPAGQVPALRGVPYPGRRYKDLLLIKGNLATR